MRCSSAQPRRSCASGFSKLSCGAPSAGRHTPLSEATRRGLRRAVITDIMNLRSLLHRAAVMVREEEGYTLDALEASIHEILSEAHGGLGSVRTGLYSFMDLRRKQEKT